MSGSRIKGNTRLLRRQLHEKLTHAWQNLLCTHAATYRWISYVLALPLDASKLEALDAAQCRSLLDLWETMGPGTPDWEKWKGAGCPGHNGTMGKKR